MYYDDDNEPVTNFFESMNWGFQSAKQAVNEAFQSPIPYITAFIGFLAGVVANVLTRKE